MKQHSWIDDLDEMIDDHGVGQIISWIRRYSQDRLSETEVGTEERTLWYDLTKQLGPATNTARQLDELPISQTARRDNDDNDDDDDDDDDDEPEELWRR
jgi:hypothetical protein